MSKRLIIFICKPETLEESNKRRAERGGWKLYYDKDKHKEYMKLYRKHLKELKDGSDT